MTRSELGFWKVLGLHGLEKEEAGEETSWWKVILVKGKDNKDVY